MQQTKNVVTKIQLLENDDIFIIGYQIKVQIRANPFQKGGSHEITSKLTLKCKNYLFL